MNNGEHRIMEIQNFQRICRKTYSQTPKQLCSGKEVSTHTLDLDISPKRKISFSLHILSHIHKTRKCCFSAEVLSAFIDPSASSMVPRFYTHTFCRLEPSYHKGKQKKKKKTTIITYYLLLNRFSP